jgi:transposase
VDSVVAEADSKIKKSLSDKNDALKRLEEAQAEKERYISELNERDQKEKDLLTEQLGSLTRKVEKQSKRFYRAVVVAAIILALALIAFILWLSDCLMGQVNAGLQIMRYLISAIPILAPLLVSPPLLGQKIESSILKGRNKKYSKQMNALNQRIGSLDSTIQERNGTKNSD